MTRHLTYIGQTPTEGTGSPVIILRHLRRLSDHGWQIRVIAEHGQDTELCRRAGWAVQHLPHRRRWWPPFRPDNALLRSLRTFLLARECRSLEGGIRPDAIFGYLAAHADFSPEIAGHYARLIRRPFSLLVHDDAAAFCKDKAEKARLRRRHNAIIRQTHRCWFVSPELAAQYTAPEASRRVLLPIPEGWEQPAVYTPERGTKGRVYYAGHIWPPQYPLLTQLARVLHEAGLRLVLLSRETPELRAFLASAPADWVKPFKENREALAHLVADAAGLVVSYTESIEEMPWVATSYPSKFVEYSYLGLPTAIVSPVDSAISNWAKRASYPYSFAPRALTEFRAWAERLRHEASWNELAAKARGLSQTSFSAENIHQELEENLLRSAATST